MIHKIIAAILICLVSLQLFSQEPLPTISDYKRFYKTKTLVVLEENPLCEYNFKIREVVKQNWKLTDYEFISYRDFEKKRFDPQYSFLITSLITFNKDKTKARYNFLNLVMGGTAKRIGNMPNLCAIPLSYLDVDEDSYVYKLACLVRFIQNHIALVSKNPSIISTNVLKYYNKNSPQLKEKTLYFVMDELQKDVNSLAKIRKIYPGKVKIVERREVEEAINNRNSDVVFMHKIGPEKTKHKARCFKILIGANDAQFYYFDYHMIKKKQTDSFLVKDFKKIVAK